MIIMNEIDNVKGKPSLAANIKGTANNFTMFFWKFFYFIFEFFSFSELAFATLFSFYSNHVSAKNPRVSQFGSTCGLLWIQ